MKPEIKKFTIAGWFVKKMKTGDFLALDAAVGAFRDGHSDSLGITLEEETEKAICLGTEWNYKIRRIWVPKSVISYELK